MLAVSINSQCARSNEHMPVQTGEHVAEMRLRSKSSSPCRVTSETWRGPRPSPLRPRSQAPACRRPTAGSRPLRERRSCRAGSRIDLAETSHRVSDHEFGADATRWPYPRERPHRQSASCTRWDGTHQACHGHPRGRREHDFASRRSLATALEPLEEDVIVDLSRCTFIETMVIGVIIGKAVALGKRGFRLELIVPPTAAFVGVPWNSSASAPS